MKRSILTSIALTATMFAFAQSTTKPAGAILISQTRNGNTVTSHYLIRHDNDRQAEFDIHYSINKSAIAPAYSTNSQQINELKDFMEGTKDTTIHISAIHIVGHASPDGNATQNDSLASHRAQALCQYAINNYHPDAKIDTSYKTFHWVDCVNTVETSAIPQKSEVLAILNSNNPEKTKEQHLRKYPEAWKYLATHILPAMRYADISFNYGIDEIVTRTTTIAQPTPQATVTTTSTQSKPKAEAVVIDEEMGIIIAIPAEESDTKQKDKKSRKADKKRSKVKQEALYW